MGWALLDDNFPHHVKVLAANRQHALAGYLFVCGLAYCRRHYTSGFIPELAVRNLGLSTSPKRPAAALVSAGLWHRVDDGYRVHDYESMPYDDFDAKEAQKERTNAKREAGRKGGIASWQARQASGNLGAVASPPASEFASNAASNAASTSAEAPSGTGGGSCALVLQERKKEMGPRDVWWFELLRRYPQDRARRGVIVQQAFLHIFESDPRPDAEIWAEMSEGLENAVRGYEWRVKGRAPGLDKWLEREGWKERYPEAPTDMLVSDKTARTLTSAAAFIAGGADGQD